MTGFEIRVLPGYQRMPEAARATLLALAEHGELERTVRVVELPGRRFRASDRSSSFVLEPDGSFDRICS